LALILESRCLATCVSVIVRGDIEAKCPGMIGSIDLETKTKDLVRCACQCHDEDSDDLYEEQEQWFNKRIVTPKGIPFKPWKTS
jgi:hypothetical protein